VLFSADAHAGLAGGAITLTFRTWRRAQVRIGGTYRVGATTLLVDDVRQVAVRDITEDDARRAGAADREALLARLASRPRGRYAPAAEVDLRPGTLVWRVAFHRVAGDDGPRLADQADLGPGGRAALDRRLDRLDAAAPGGPWTRATLALIAAHPGVVSTTLAAQRGRERMAFKADVRKLKRLGLTESLRTGYRLSPRGAAYLAAGDGP
jgi:hypothetical protein